MRAEPVRRSPYTRIALLALAVAVGVILCVARNIHGAALLGGLIIAALPSRKPLAIIRT
jgi:hypothetical protein